MSDKPPKKPDESVEDGIIMDPHAGAIEDFAENTTVAAIPSRVHPGDAYDEPPKRAHRTMPDANNVKSTDTEPTFTKALQEINQQLPNAPISAKAKWLISLVIALVTTIAAPLTITLQEYYGTQAKEEKEFTQKKASALAQQRKMQADLLKRIIAVAEKATVKNPNSILQLGLIARMVNENHTVFGIHLDQAEQTLNSMSNRLAPLSGLRKRLAESAELIADITNKFEQAKKYEADLIKQRDELRADLKKLKPSDKWRQNQIKQDIDQKSRDLAKHVVRRRFYETQLKREQHYRRYFKRQLAQQSEKLQAALRDVADARDIAKEKSREVDTIVALLQRAIADKRDITEIVQRLKAKLSEISENSSQNQQTTLRLSAELNSERKELALLRANYLALKTACVAPHVMPSGGGGGGMGGSLGNLGVETTGNIKVHVSAPVLHRAGSPHRPVARRSPRRHAPVMRTVPRRHVPMRALPRRRTAIVDGLFED